MTGTAPRIALVRIPDRPKCCVERTVLITRNSLPSRRCRSTTRRGKFTGSTCESLESRTLLTFMPLFEPGDAFANAVQTEVSPEQPFFFQPAVIGDGPFAAADVDLYQIELSAGDRIAIDTDIPQGSEILDPVLRVFDAAAIQRGFSDDNPAPGEMASLEAFVDFVAPHTGTYFVGVSGFGNLNYNPISPGTGTPGSTGAYELSIELFPSLMPPGEELIIPIGEPGNEPFPPPEGPTLFEIPIIEPPIDEPPEFPEVELTIDVVGNDIENAATLPLNANGAGSLPGEIETSGDVDVFRVEATQNGLVRIRQIATPGSPLDTFVGVLTSNGELIAQNDDDGAGLNSLVQFPVSAGTTFFVQAGAFGDTTGAYRIEIDLRNVRADDFGNSDASATVLPLDPDGTGRRLGEIEFSGDRDVFRVTATQTGLLNIRQQSVPGSNLDSFLRVRDDDGNELGVNDDDGGSLNSLVQVPVVEGQTLFVEAGAFGPGRGRYELIVSAAASIRDDAGDSVATAVTLDTSVTGTIVRPGRINRPGDRDVFRFVPTDSGRVTIRQRAETGDPLDTFLRVLDADGQRLAANDDDGFSLNSRVSLPVTAGTAVFIEAGAFGQSVGSYVVEVAADRTAVDDFGNDIASANVAGGTEFRGQIEASGDVDVFRVQAAQSGFLTIRQRATVDSSLDSFLRILDSDGEVLATNDDDRFSLNSVTTVSVTAGDTIYVEAGAFSTSTGRYVVTVTADGDDFGNETNSNATPLVLNASGAGSLRGAINFESDLDVFRLSPASDSVITIDLAANSGESLDTFVEILSNDGEVILVDDDGGDGLNSRLTFDAKSGETYFVRASSFGGTTGRYELSASSTFELDDAGNTFPDARLVVLDDTGAGTSEFSLINQTDVDVFQFVATVSGEATVQFNNDDSTAPDRVLIFEEADESSETQRNHIRVARDSDGDGSVTFSVLEGSTYFVEAARGNGDFELQVSTDASATDEAKIDEDVADDAADLFRLGLASILTGETDDTSLDVFTATLEETAEFLRDKLGTDEPLLILGLDPVDYVVTDASGRQAGYTATDGEINEVGSNVFNSGDGVAELLVISNPSSDVFQLDLVGVGTDYRGGAAYVDSSGVQTTTFDGTLTKGNLEVALDFSNAESAEESADGDAVEARVDFFASVSDTVARTSTGQSPAVLNADSVDFTQSTEAATEALDDSDNTRAGEHLADAVSDAIDSLLSWLTERTTEEQESDLVDRAWTTLRESILDISSGALELMTDLLESVDQELPEEQQATQGPTDEAEDTKAAAKDKDREPRTAEGSPEKSTAEAKPEDATEEKPVTTAQAPQRNTEPVKTSG